MTPQVKPCQTIQLDLTHFQLRQRCDSCKLSCTAALPWFAMTSSHSSIDALHGSVSLNRFTKKLNQTCMCFLLKHNTIDCISHLDGCDQNGWPRMTTLISSNGIFNVTRRVPDSFSRPRHTISVLKWVIEKVMALKHWVLPYTLPMKSLNECE